MKVRDVMTPDVEVVRPNATVQEAAQKMKSMDVGPLPVCDGEKILGMVTDRDITVRVVAEAMDPKQTPVANIMTPQVIYCYDDQDINDAARLMQQNQIRRLLVMDRSKKLVGVVSLGDIAAKTGNDQMSGKTLEQVSEPAEPARKAA